MTPTIIPSPSLNDPVRRLRAAQRDWAGLPVWRRLRPVKALRHLLVRNCDSLCAAVAEDLGKPGVEVMAGEVLPLADACRFLECEAAGLLRPRRVPGRLRPLWLFGQRDAVHRRPRGVVGLIGTWNYPLYLNGVQLLQALTAGNAVLWKPSEVAPHSALALHRLLEEAGFPAGLVHRLEATREAGQALTDADIDHVVFTGSAAVGRRLAGHLGRRLISSTLELSGCDAQFVLDDADVALAARAAWFGAVLNRGQTCLAVRRSLVHRSLYSSFQEELRTLAAGAAPVQVALESQAEQAARLVRDALTDGARLLAGAPLLTAASPRECVPTVLMDARPEMAVCREASFAPLLTVLPFDTLDEALEMDAVCPYALGASIFTRDRRRAEELAARLRAGAVTVNDVVVPTAHPATPFGGRGDSGWGVTQGAEGLLEMTVAQVVSHRRGTYRPHYDMVIHPTAGQAALVRGFLESAHAPTWLGRLRGWWRLLVALCRGG